MSVVEFAPETSVAPVVTERDVLHRAADLLEEFGWKQADIGSKDRGGFCMLGAVIEANLDLGRYPFDGLGRVMPISAALFAVTGARAFGCAPVDWNNASGRTKEEVVAKLREAAERI